MTVQSHPLTDMRIRLEQAILERRLLRMDTTALGAQLKTVRALSATAQCTVRELRDGVGSLDTSPLGIVPMRRWVAEHAPPADPSFVAFGWEHVRGTPALAASLCTAIAMSRPHTA